MPLSEHEQKILDEIERRLAAEDPKFARATAVATPRGDAVRKIKRSVVLFAAGLLLLVTGLVTGLDNANMLIAFGIAGFVVMLVSVLFFVKASKTMTSDVRARPKRTGWFDRMEERWKHRFDDPGRN